MDKCYAIDVIKVAEKYVGYLEKESNKDLEEFKANAGDGNYTIFAKRFYELTGINNQAQPWCDMFVDTSFVEAFGKDKAKELLVGFNAYTPSSAQYFKDKKQWYDDPQVGDIIFFKNAERICHTGIVYKVDKTYVYTIEGNTSAGGEVIPNGGAVCKKQYVLNNPRIAGYGRPNYDKQSAVKAVVTAVVKPGYYIVKQGDTLSEIAAANKTTVDKIVKLNKLKDANTISIGQKIRIK